MNDESTLSLSAKQMHEVLLTASNQFEAKLKTWDSATNTPDVSNSEERVWNFSRSIIRELKTGWTRCWVTVLVSWWSIKLLSLSHLLIDDVRIDPDTYSEDLAYKPVIVKQCLMETLTGRFKNAVSHTINQLVVDNQQPLIRARLISLHLWRVSTSPNFELF